MAWHDLAPAWHIPRCQAGARSSTNAVEGYEAQQGVPDHRPLVQDGVFGPSTAHWVGWFQRFSGLKGDQIVGPRTGTAILNEYVYPFDFDTGTYCDRHLPTVM